VKKTDDRLIHAGLLAVALFYGANYSISKILTPEYVTPFGFIIFRILGAGLFFWLLDFKPERIDWRKHGKRLVACAVFGVATNQLLFFKGISMTAAVNGSIIMTLNPVFVFILSAILLNERMGKFKIVGLIISMIGALMIIYQPATELGTGDWRGDLLILLNALSYAIYLVLAKPLMATYKPLTITKWIFLFGFFLALPVGGYEAFTTDFSKFTSEAWLSGLYVIFGVTIFAYFVNIWAMRQVHPSLVGIYIYVQPLFASFIAISIFGERLTFLHIVAAGLIFTGIYLVNRRARA
jgi:drug/metabolite transporter (DMT)-like permease